MSSVSPTRLDPRFISLPLAHRGLHDAQQGAIENAPLAIERAIKAGYGIEIDVQLSLDACAMVFHDYDLDRLTAASGQVAKRSAAELGQVTLSGSNDQIPTLRAVLASVQGRVPLLIEIKDQDGGLQGNVGPLEAAVASDVAGYEGPLAVMSFNPHSVKAFADLAPDVAIGLVTDPMEAAHWPAVSAKRRKELADIADADRLNVDFISHNQRDLASLAIGRLKAAGLPILCWTVRDAASEQKARQVADNITFEGYLPPRPQA